MDGVISGSANLIKGGNGIVTLRGSNLYTGNTVVESGTLAAETASFADAATLTITPGAVLDLRHGLADTVDFLVINGEPVSPGSYGGSASGAAIKDDVHFNAESTGYLVVTSGPASDDYGTWSGATGFNLTGGMEDDDDRDGISNRDEYAFGLDPTRSGSVSAVSTPDRTFATFTYTRRNPSVFSTGLTYRYGYSTTLAGEFTAFLPQSEVGDGGSPVETVTVTLPGDLLANPALFVQVIVE